MIFSELDASGYKYSVVFYNTEFENILSKVIICYNLMKSNKVVLKNNENEIRDVLYLNYLNNNEVRQKVGLKDYYFDRETKEDKKKGRTDLRILTHDSFEDTSAYYIIECKRLDAKNQSGTSGLNAEYIKNGISRFITETYSAYYKTNGMIGFIVESMDIAGNINSINTLMKTEFKGIKTLQLLKYISLYKGFNCSYCSLHKTRQSEILLYHLMFDFSGNIQ